MCLILKPYNLLKIMKNNVTYNDDIKNIISPVSVINIIYFTGIKNIIIQFLLFSC